MDSSMYLFCNRGAGMSPGKLAAQVAHAAVEAYRITPPESNLLRLWYRGGHHKKIVLHADNADHLKTIERYLNDRGFATTLIIDEGRTEITPHTPTALGVELVDKDDPHVAATFSSFSLYSDVPPDVAFQRGIQAGRNLDRRHRGRWRRG